MTDPTSMPDTTTVTLVTIFERLFESDFATLDDIAISRHLPAGIEYIDQSAVLDLWLLDKGPDASFQPSNTATYALHETAYELLPEAQVVVSGRSRHLRALLLEEMALPRSTSMLRRRGVTDLGEHLVAPEALVGSDLRTTLTDARERARRNRMDHVLVLTTQGLVVAAGANAIETMAHWHNVEFAARIECMRVEDAVVIQAARG